MHQKTARNEKNSRVILASIFNTKKSNFIFIQVLFLCHIFLTPSLNKSPASNESTSNVFS